MAFHSPGVPDRTQTHPDTQSPPSAAAGSSGRQALWSGSALGVAQTFWPATQCPAVGGCGLYSGEITNFSSAAG
eukprot:SAG22_NODE_8641_length_640_cov_0.731978_1_plen_73_part_01